MPSPNHSTLTQDILDLGATHAHTINVSEISFYPELREACKQNHCGNYGRNWTCPPNIGEIHQLISKLKTYQKAIVFQTITEIEDSYDFEGMMLAGQKHHSVIKSIQDILLTAQSTNTLILGAGGCPLCPTCALVDQKPCRHPSRAIASLEAHGIHVAKLAESAQMNYINGINTVTYFGAVFF